jgi:probable addiction module antidote protein
MIGASGGAVMMLESFDKTLERELKDPEFTTAFLQEALDESLEEFLVSLRKVVQANGGMTRCAELTHLSREAIYRMLSETGNPELRSIEDILNAYNLRLSIRPRGEGELVAVA